MGSPAIKVLLASCKSSKRELITAFRQSSRIKIVGVASNGEETIRSVDATDPNVVLIDIHITQPDALECTRRIRKSHPWVKVLIVSEEERENYLVDILEAGGSGYILKNSIQSEIHPAIKKIADDGIYMGAEFTLSMFARYRAGSGIPKNAPAANIKITDREMQVLHLIADGYTNTEMAHQLSTSVRTIETRRKKLLDKTGTKNTATLIRFAILNGLIN